MYDEDEVEGLGVGDAIEDEHRLDGKMPRAGTMTAIEPTMNDTRAHDNPRCDVKSKQKNVR